MPTVIASLDFFAELEVFLPKIYCNYTFFVIYMLISCVFIETIQKSREKKD